MMSPINSPIETIEYNGYLIETHYDGDANANDPREWCNLGQIVVWNTSNWKIGDKSQDLYTTTLACFLEECIEQKPYVLPLRFDDYGSHGCKLQVYGEFDPTYQFDYSDRINGFIYVTRERLMKEYSLDCPEAAFMYACLVTDHIYDEKNPDRVKHPAVCKILEQEIITYNHYLNGEVYGYVIKNLDGSPAGDYDYVDSCWGYIGEYDYMITEAKQWVDSAISHKQIEDQMAERYMAL